MCTFESRSKIVLLLTTCRENELLKHQLKKYVGAVQALRSGLQGRSSEATEGEKPLKLSVISIGPISYLLTWAIILGRERLLSNDVKHVIVQAEMLDEDIDSKEKYRANLI